MAYHDPYLIYPPGMAPEHGNDGPPGFPPPPMPQPSPPHDPLASIEQRLTSKHYRITMLETRLTSAVQNMTEQIISLRQENRDLRETLTRERDERQQMFKGILAWVATAIGSAVVGLISQLIVRSIK